MGKLVKIPWEAGQNTLVRGNKQYVINFRKIGVHVRKRVNHLSQLPPVVLVEARLRICFRRIRSLCQFYILWVCLKQRSTTLTSTPPMQS